MNILYGVPGEGMGHATRSRVVIEHLLQQHDVQVLSSSRAYKFLHRHFGTRVHEIKGLHFAYKNAEISKLGTFLLNLKNAPESLLHNFSQYLLIDKSFKPDLVISDFESFTNFFAKLNRLPLISIDNMQVMDRCRIDARISEAEKADYLLARSIVKAKVPNARHYFITSFFRAPVVRNNTSVLPPLIRDEILRAGTDRQDHLLMYQTSSSFPDVKKVLKQLPAETFYVYGMNRDERDGNIIFKPFSEEGFIRDFASAKAVIANGGFSFLSEAVYLHKPVYAFPIRGQFEQYLNAAYIEKEGYGRHFATLDADNLKAFIYDLPLFEKCLENYRQDGNNALFSALDTWIGGMK